MFLILIGVLGPVAKSEAAWTKVQPVAGSPEKIVSFDSAVGDDGYAVMAFVRKSQTRPFVGSVWVRVKEAGQVRFSEPRYRGSTSSDFLAVEIGRTGLTLLAYPDSDGDLHIQQRWPTGNWKVEPSLTGADSDGAKISIGRDNTAVATELNFVGDNDPANEVRVAVRDPDTGKFGPWRVISTDPATVGFRSSTVVGTKGRATIVWADACSPGSSVEARWVDVDHDSFTEPTPIENAGCVAWDIDLQQDGFGNQYLRLGLLTGVQMATRRPGQGFSKATRVTTLKDLGDGGYLSVSPSGLATLIWGRNSGGNGLRTEYRYVTSWKGSAPTASQKIEGPVVIPRGHTDFLRSVAPLPHGKVAMLFIHGWTTKKGWPIQRLGSTAWKPGTKFKRPRFEVAARKGRDFYPVGIETSHDGSRLAWWHIEGGQRARTIGWWWKGLFR